MPNGFGFNWPGHSPRGGVSDADADRDRTGGPDGLFLAAQTAVRALAAADGIKLAKPTTAASAPAPAPRHRSPGQRRGGRAPGRPGAGPTFTWRPSRWRCWCSRAGDRHPAALARRARLSGGARAAAARRPGRRGLVPRRGGCSRRAGADGRRRGAAGGVAVVVRWSCWRAAADRRRPTRVSWRSTRPGSGNAAVARGAGLHARRPVRPAGVAALVPGQGRDPGLQRLGVHDRLPAHDQAMLRGQGDARQRRLRTCSCSASTPIPHATSLEDVLVLLATARDAARVALPDRLAARSSSACGSGYAVEAAVERGEITHTRRCS